MSYRSRDRLRRASASRVDRGNKSDNLTMGNWRTWRKGVATIPSLQRVLDMFRIICYDALEAFGSGSGCRRLFEIVNWKKACHEKTFVIV